MPLNHDNVVREIVQRRKDDIERLGYTFGINIPDKRCRPLVPFMRRRGAILEIKRASPSKGDIAPDLVPVELASTYKKSGARAISVLTEMNYFKGSLEDLINIGKAHKNIALLRKDFLIDEQEVEISYRCGADAVLLIAGILTEDKMRAMLNEVSRLKMRALIEIRTDDDVRKALKLYDQFQKNIIFGVNSRNLKTFKIDKLVPLQFKNKLKGPVIFESGIVSLEDVKMVSSSGFFGFLMGETAARNPELTKDYVNTFLKTKKRPTEQFFLKYADLLTNRNDKGYSPLVKICGLKNEKDCDKCIKNNVSLMGFIFSPAFPRNVDPEVVRNVRKTLNLKEVKTNHKPLMIGVVTELSSKQALLACAFARKGILDAVQLHNVPEEELSKVNLNKIPHYYTYTSRASYDGQGNNGSLRCLQDFKDHTYHDNGSSWIAGGITTENVKELIETYHPELVDMSSGVETQGKMFQKDVNKIKEVIKCTMKA